MDTIWLLMARYEGLPIIPLETVRQDYFPHIGKDKLWPKIRDGLIPLAVVKIEDSQKSARGVHIRTLAKYLDDQTAKGEAECDRMYA